MVELFPLTNTTSIFGPGLDNAYAVGTAYKADGEHDTCTGVYLDPNLPHGAAPMRNQLKRIIDRLEGKPIDPRFPVKGDYTLGFHNGKVAAIVQVDNGGLDINGKPSADQDLVHSAALAMNMTPVGTSALKNSKGATYVSFATASSFADIKEEDKPALLVEAKALLAIANEQGRFPIYRKEANPVDKELAGDFSRRLAKLEKQVYDAPSVATLNKASQIAKDFNEGKVGLEAFKEVSATDLRADLIVASNTRETTQIPADIEVAKPTAGAAAYAYEPTTAPLTKERGQRTLTAGLERKAADESDEDYKRRKKEKMAENLAFAPAEEQPFLTAILALILFAMGEKEAAVALLEGMGSEGIQKNDPTISSSLTRRHNSLQTQSDYNGSAARDVDIYNKTASKVSNGALYPQANKTYSDYTPLPPVDVPTTEMTKNFSVNGGEVDIVRNGMLVSNSNAVFARYLAEVCDKAKAGREKLPDDAPAVTLSTAHFYVDGTQGARLANGVWEHERSTYKNDLLRGIYEQAGVKTHILQENVTEQVKGIAQGRGSLLKYPIGLKADHADRDNALYPAGHHFTQETHFNGVENSSANGYEIIHGRNANSETVALASRFAAEQPRHTGINLRATPIISGAYGFPNQAKSPVFLSEDGFESNARDSAKLASAEETYKSAYADAKAGIKHFLSNGAMLKDCAIVRECVDEMVVSEKANKHLLVAQLRPVEQTVVAKETPAPAQEPIAPASAPAPIIAANNKVAPETPVALITMPPQQTLNENYRVHTAEMADLEQKIEALPAAAKDSVVKALTNVTTRLKNGTTAAPAEGARKEVADLMTALENAGINPNELNSGFNLVHDVDEALSGKEDFKEYAKQVVEPLAKAIETAGKDIKDAPKDAAKLTLTDGALKTVDKSVLSAEKIAATNTIC